MGGEDDLPDLDGADDVRFKFLHMYDKVQFNRIVHPNLSFSFMSFQPNMFLFFLSSNNKS